MLLVDSLKSIPPALTRPTAPPSPYTYRLFETFKLFNILACCAVTYVVIETFSTDKLFPLRLDILVLPSVLSQVKYSVPVTLMIL